MLRINKKYLKSFNNQMQKAIKLHLCDSCEHANYDSNSICLGNCFKNKIVTCKKSIKEKQVLRMNYNLYNYDLIIKCPEFKEYKK